MSSRVSLKAFLAKAKSALARPPSKPVTFVVGNESAGKTCHTGPEAGHHDDSLANAPG